MSSTMSAATPSASSQSPAATSPAQPTQETSSNIPAADRIVVEYLRARGHTQAAKSLLEELESSSQDDASKSTNSLSAEDLIKALAIFAQQPSKPGDNVLKDSANVLQELGTMGNPVNIQNLIASIGSVGAEEIFSLDPMDKEEGFRELEAWVDGSLDMYRVNPNSIPSITSL